MGVSEDDYQALAARVMQSGTSDQVLAGAILHLSGLLAATSALLEAVQGDAELDPPDLATHTSMIRDGVLGIQKGIQAHFFPDPSPS